ncbi:hypothetical protein HAX54_006132, partial [Datura stramonium]|nr:hypothetical protein [Datura stramonium]
LRRKKLWFPTGSTIGGGDDGLTGISTGPRACCSLPFWRYSRERKMKFIALHGIDSILRARFIA